MSACCGVRDRMTVHGCFERGLRTRRKAPLATPGGPVAGGHGLWAEFSVNRENGFMQGVRFTSSACTTLVAYCQALLELVEGASTQWARQVTPVRLIEHLPGVPPAQRDRAVLAVAAFQAVIRSTGNQDNGVLSR